MRGTATKAIRWLCAALLLGGCARAASEHEMGDDHGIDLEAAEVVAGLDADGVSPVYQAHEPFERLGLIWDADDGASLEVRTATDGEWSEWRAPEAFFAEEGAYAGKVDPPALATAYQYRIRPGTAAPTRLVLSPIVEIAPEAGLVEEDAIGDIDAEDAADWGIENADEVVVEVDLPNDDAALAAATGEDGVGAAREAISDRGLVVRSRRAWGARRPRCRSGTSPTRATIHHTVTSNSPSSVRLELRRIQAFHMDGNGWCDIGYNYVVSRGGTVWRARGARALGAHTANANSGNVGIALLGTYTNSGAPSAMRTGTAKLLRRLRRSFPISLNRNDVKGHRQFGGTACPGAALYRQLGGIVSLAAR